MGLKVSQIRSLKVTFLTISMADPQRGEQEKPPYEKN